jgi:hypothetical protein
MAQVQQYEGHNARQKFPWELGLPGMVDYYFGTKFSDENVGGNQGKGNPYKPPTPKEFIGLHIPPMPPNKPPEEGVPKWFLWSIGALFVALIILRK